MLKTQFITLDEFKDYFVDIDLRVALGSEESAIAFLKRVEDRMESYVAANFHKDVGYEFKYFTDYQKKHYKRALLEQAVYVFRNGDISVDSGYEQDKGVIADNSILRKISLAPNARQELMLCGLYDRHISGISSGLSGDWWLR